MNWANTLELRHIETDSLVPGLFTGADLGSTGNNPKLLGPVF